jgi:hypothetical protein
MSDIIFGQRIVQLKDNVTYKKSRKKLFDIVGVPFP